MKDKLRMLSGTAAMLIMAGIILTGCMTEDLSDCGSESRITVRAYTNEGADCAADVNDVVLYVFDKDYGFIEEIETTVGATVPVNVPIKEHVYVYAWGNLCGGCQMRPAFGVGEHKDARIVSLHAQTRSAVTHQSPDDLFLGNATVPYIQNGDDVEVTINRVTGSMGVAIKKLKEYGGHDDEKYSIVVRDTYNSISMDGGLSGDRASYRPAGSFVTESGEERFFVPAFNMMPEEDGISIDIYHDGTLLTTISSHNGGQPIVVKKGVLTQVNIDFGATLNVGVELLPWGSQNAGKEF